MNQDLWIFICTHGKFGEELMKSAEMIAGEVENVYSFSLLPGMAPEDYKALVEAKLKEAPTQVLCLVDLFGGTPCNTCATLSKDYDVQVLTGINLAMYIELTSQKNNYAIADLLEVGLNTLKESGKNVIEEMNKRK